MTYRTDPRRNRRRARLTPHMLRPARPASSPLPRIFAALMLGVLVLSGLTAASGVGTAYTAYAQLAESIKPRLEAMASASESFQTTRIYDRNGALLYEFFGAGRRTRVELDKVAPELINATIAIEDKTFFENTGVDYEGMAKAFARSLEAGEETGGASTITQQLIKLVILTGDELAYENRYQRKVTEIILAQELSQQYSKEEILALYLNEIYYGNLAYGIEAAANTYFDRSANELTLAQSALLAGLPQLPNEYDPYNYSEGGKLPGLILNNGWLEEDYLLPETVTPPKWRQIAVLRQMVDEGYVSDQQARIAVAQDLVLSSRQVPLNAPHFVYYVRRQLEEKYGPEFANRGLSVYTSIDLELQNMVQQKAAERIADLEERNIHNAAVVVMQPNTGEILAMVGSIDYNKIVPTKTPGEKGNVVDGQVNVTVRERQPGSALKPFTYLAAMEQGLTPASVLWDVPTKFPLSGSEWYEPKNYNGRWNGPVRMRTALANSLNMPAVKALKFAGIQHTIDLLRRSGVTSLRQGEGFYGLALTLGGGAVTPLELTTAYNTLASAGRYYPPISILKVVGGDGRVIDQYTPSRRSLALNPDHVAIINDMLSDDKAREPIWGLNSKLKLSRPAAVKTGTSNDWRDAWAVGYTPYVTVGVWTGNNNNEETKKVESLTGGGVIWHNVMEELFSNPRFQKILLEPYPDGKLPLTFELTPNLDRRPVCRLPGPFNNFSQDLFTPQMIVAMQRQRGGSSTQAISSTVTITNTAQRYNNDGCQMSEELPVYNYGGPLPTDLPEGEASLDLGQYYCRPEGLPVPPELMTTLTIWKLPPPDPSERTEYRWDRGRAMGAEQIPICDDQMLIAVGAPTTIYEPGAVLMPDLKGLGENQAKEQLALMGIFDVYVDYQSRDRIPDIYDQYGPYVVVSSLPGPGEWVLPGTTVVLGIREP
jgi:membrane peptidoglycan carboxypeptidase